MAKAKNAEEITLEEVADSVEKLEKRVSELEKIAKDEDKAFDKTIANIQRQLDEIISTIRMG